MTGGWLIEIVVLAMIAAFVALRLVSVLGRRTGHEQPVSHPLDRTPVEAPVRQPGAGEARDQPVIVQGGDLEPAAVDGVRAIVAADPSFDVGRFLQGATAAYRMVLEAFWKGDKAELQNLADESVVRDFVAAIDDRATQGLTIDNRLVRIDRAVITEAALNGMMAQITVKFDADLVAVTRDASGNVIAGSTSDAVSTHDIWTFSRHVRATDPNWLLIATDEDAA